VIELEKLVELAKAGDLPGVTDLVRQNPGLTLLRLPGGESPLMAALYRGRHDVVAALVDMGADVDVFAAAALGRIPELRRALARPGAVNGFAYDGWTPLHLAAFFGQEQAVGLLLEAGADLAAVSRNGLQNTPLHAASAGKHVGVALALLEAGADPRAVDAGGYTAEAIATENGLTAVVEAIAHKRP
jgi:ankyrin repeat protein